MRVPLHFIAAPKPPAQKAAAELIDRYGQTDLADAICVIAIGGDGTTLNALQAVLATPHVPVCSMRTPNSVGALGNPLAFEKLTERLAASHRIAIKPLQFEAKTAEGKVATGAAINEVAIARFRFQATRLLVHVGTELADLFGDGLVIASAIGSRGYCRALGGPRLPLDAEMLSLRQPAEGFHLAVPGHMPIRVSIADPLFRPARIEAHAAVVSNVREVIVKGCCQPTLTLLLEASDRPA